jgi:hypothetical protein
LVLVGGAVAAFAAEPPKVETPAIPPPATWGWRELVKQKVETDVASVPPPKQELELSPLLVHAAPDADVVTLAPFHVNGDRVNQQLRVMYARQEKQQKEDLVMRRLGIGAHTVGYKHFGAGVVTVFYVPVFAGFGFSW